MDPIRISYSADCRLKTAHRLVGTEVVEIRRNRIKMKRGTVLEPIIIEELVEAGIHVEFIGDQQLELVCNEPGRVGHPDGIIDPALSQRPFAPWLEDLLPDAFHKDLEHNRPVLLEVKTMNDGSFKHFKRKGLEGHPWLSRYEYQIQSYHHCLSDPAMLELWDSGDFKDLEANAGQKLADGILLCAFNKATDEFAFQYIKSDKKFFDHISGQLQEMVEWVEAGQLPAPDHDGRHMECQDCPFAYCCPAVEQLLEAEEDEGQEVEGTLADTVDELGMAYDQARTMEKEGKDRKTAVKEIVETDLGIGIFKTPNFRVGLVSVNGRETVDMDELKVIADELDFKIPKKTGKSFTQISVLQRYGVK